MEDGNKPADKEDAKTNSYLFFTNKLSILRGAPEFGDIYTKNPPTCINISHLRFSL
jgi:hypothetical protein